MTDEQKKKKHSSQTSMFNAYLWQHFGGKGFVMAVWQTGISWAPPAEMMKNNYTGALKHIAHNFGQGAQLLCRARTAHQDDPKTKEAQRKSGSHTRGGHGLSSEELANRNAREKARSIFFYAINLQRQLEVLKGKGKGKRKGNVKGEGKSVAEQHWLRELWSGRLKKELRRTEQLCHKVQANDFCVFDYKWARGADCGA